MTLGMLSVTIMTRKNVSNNLYPCIFLMHYSPLLTDTSALPCPLPALLTVSLPWYTMAPPRPLPVPPQHPRLSGTSTPFLFASEFTIRPPSFFLLGACNHRCDACLPRSFVPHTLSSPHSHSLHTFTVIRSCATPFQVRAPAFEILTLPVPHLASLRYAPR